jgi:hypothetical protein
MRAAVQGEGHLKSMPNNTAIMISFAACFALRLSMLVARNNLSLAPSIKILVEETADVLERIGTIPSHRKGTGALFGRHLREIVRNMASSVGALGGSGQSNNDPLAQDTFISPGRPVAGNNNRTQNEISPGLLSFEPILFSAMSENQIMEAINNAEDELQVALPNIQIDENSGLDWLDWFSNDFAA